VSDQAARSDRGAGPQTGLTGQGGLDLYARMSYLRAFEERADTLYRQGLIHGPAHLGLGHGAIAVGAASVARRRDFDPLLRVRKELEQAGTSAAALDEADARARADVLALAERVLARPVPDPATAWTDVWAAEENPGQLGWGASIAAIVAEEAFGDLAAPVRRVSGGNVPLPVAASLEAEVDVSVPRVAGAVRAAGPGHRLKKFLSA
jgi:TPP-dependent pyruvate/acetoin dehydrogenase alpha subunit